ncbi:MAG: site-specific integrase [Betaproteobacteria bacterium]|nr:site-specific integrase [Betaproteobacteria bacterium]
MSIDVKQRGSAWRARVRAYGYPTKSATFDTHREAHDWAVITQGEYLAEIKSGKCPNPKLAHASESSMAKQAYAPLISSILKHYWRTALPNKASCDQEKGRIKRLIAYFWKKHLHEVTEQYLENFKTLRFAGKLGAGRGRKNGTVYLLKNHHPNTRKPGTSGGNVKNPSSQTVRHELALLRRAVTYWGRTRKIRLPNGQSMFDHPIMTVPLPDKAAARTRRFTDDELIRLVTSIHNPSTRAAVTFAACTSLRRTEILTLRWEDLDIERRVIKLHRSGYAKKSKVKEREVPLIPAAIEILTRLGLQDAGTIWPLSPASFTQAFGRAKERAGLKDARLHDLRREAISRLVEIYNLGLEKIMNFSGHRETRTLVEHYMKPQSQNIAAEIAKSKPDIFFIPLL